MPHSNSRRTLNFPGNVYPVHRLQTTRRQAGMTMFGWLVMFCVLGFLGNIGITLAPHYMSNNAIIDVVEGLSPEVWRGSNQRKMHEAVDKGLKINNIRTLKSKEVLKIERTKTVTKVMLNYEVRESLFGNIDAVLVFKKDYQF